ncbi:MAG: T9SS type A sorting domain-containing protein [Bacteroidota bacterium]
MNTVRRLNNNGNKRTYSVSLSTARMNLTPMKSLITGVIILCIHQFIYAQSTFQVKFGGPGFEGPTSILLTHTHDILIGGYSDSFVPGASRSFLTKTDSIGNLNWSVYLFDSLNNSIRHMIETFDGSIAIAGSLDNFNISFIAKLDTTNTIPWSYSIDGRVVSLLESPDSGLIIVTRHPSSARGLFITKMDAAGNTIWSREYLTTITPFGSFSIADAAIGPDGNITLSGSVLASSGIIFLKAFLMRINSSGDVQWARTIGDGSYYYEGGTRIIPNNDNGNIICGITSLMFQAIRLYSSDSTGSIRWSKTYQVPGMNTGTCNIYRKINGNLIIDGYYADSLQSEYGFLLEVDSLGTVVAANAYTDQINNIVNATVKDDFDFIYYTSIDRYYQDVLFGKIDSSGSAFCSTIPLGIIAVNASNNSTVESVFDSTGTPILASIAKDVHYYTFSKMNWCNPLLSAPNLPAVSTDFSITPNPANATASISLPGGGNPERIIVTDLLGNFVTDQIIKHATPFTLTTDNLPNGIYLVTAIFSEMVLTKKLLVTH